MNAKEKLIEILKENSKLKEELHMRKENEETKDTQVTPGEPAPAKDGAKSLAGETSKDVIKENEETKDSQVEPSPSMAPPSDGAKLVADTTTKDTMKENGELTDDDKVVEILEALKNEIDDLKTRMEKLEGTGNAADATPELKEEKPEVKPEEEPVPQAPIQERMSLDATFKETMSETDTEFTQVVKNLFA
jgi:hypothetical protein